MTERQLAPVTVVERGALMAGAILLLLGLACLAWLGWWWATIPALVVLAAFNMSRLVKARQAGYGEGVVMAVWGIALCILGVAVVADAGAWALWLLAGVGISGWVLLLVQTRRDRRRLRDLLDQVQREIDGI